MGGGKEAGVATGAPVRRLGVGLRIREVTSAVESVLLPVRDLSDRLFASTLTSHPFLERRAAVGKEHLLVIERRDAVVGFLRLMSYPQSGLGWIERLGVEPALTLTGIAERLADAAMARLALDCHYESKQPEGLGFWEDAVSEVPAGTLWLANRAPKYSASGEETCTRLGWVATEARLDRQASIESLYQAAWGVSRSHPWVQTAFAS